MCVRVDVVLRQSEDQSEAKLGPRRPLLQPPLCRRWATQRHSPKLAAVPVSSRGRRTHDDAHQYGWYPAQVLRRFVPHDMTDAAEVESKVHELMSQVHTGRLTHASRDSCPRMLTLGSIALRRANTSCR